MSSSRRDFLQQSAAAGIGFWTLGGVVGAEKKESPNDKINIACIGVGGKGSSDTDQASNHGNIVALCDIDDNHLQNKSIKVVEKGGQKEKIKRFPHAKEYSDYRKMFDEMAKGIDAVVVSTPDHSHTLPSMIAMQLGKHVYCQKPLTHTVFEARQMREAARKYKVATQMGNQGSASDGLRRAVEIIQAGAIGHVREAHVWTDRPGKYWPQAPTITKRPEPSPVPPHVHWDLFLGPAPERPYTSAYHSFKWRGWWDFGTGALGDMACHTANMAFRALKLGSPTNISAESGEVNLETYPAWARITFDFPTRGDLPPVKFFWYEGKRDGKKVLPPEELLAKVLKPGEKLSDSGSMLVGDKGILFSPNDYGEQYVLLPSAQFKDYKGPEKTLPRNGRGDDGMKAEWVAAIKGGPPALSNFDFAGMLTETILLGNVAIRVGKPLEWDGPALKVTNCPEAEQYIKTEYRKGWSW